jgi:hypothetical protein
VVVPFQNIQKKLSLTSGETPDMSKIEQVLVDTLKPFKKTKLQGREFTHTLTATFMKAL